MAPTPWAGAARRGARPMVRPPRPASTPPSGLFKGFDLKTRDEKSKSPKPSNTAAIANSFTWIDIVAANPPSWVNLDAKVAILPSTTRKGTTLSTSAALDSPSVISQLVSPPQASDAGTSAESENSSYNLDDVSAVLDDNGSLGSFLNATIARSRQIENTEISNENTVTPVNSPESVEHSSDDFDEDYVELDDDFIDKCNATTSDPLYPEGHPKRVEQDSQRTKEIGAPSKKKKKKHKNVVEFSEPVNDPNSISISDAETESGNERDKDNDKNDASDKEEVEDESEKHAKNKKYTKEDFIAKKHDIVSNKRKIPNEEISTMLANYSFNGKVPKKLGDPDKLIPTDISLQMADKSTAVSVGICEDVPVQVANNCLILTDFVVLEMPEDDNMSIILGRPFLNTAGAVIDCNKGKVTFNVDDKEHTVYFPKRIGQKRKMDNHTFGEMFERETTSTGRPSRTATRFRRSYNEDVLAPSFEAEEDNGVPNASSFPCYNFLSNAGLLDDFLVLINNVGLTTYTEDERDQYYMLTKIFVESFQFNNKHYQPSVAFRIYGNPITMKLKDFCTALDIAPVGTAKKIENNPKALLELYRDITNDDSRTIQRGKIRNIQLPAIRYFASYLATSILGRENTSNISSYHLAFLVAALTGETPYHLGALVARRLSNKGPIFGEIVASRILAYLDLPLDPTDVKLTPIRLDIAAMKSHQFVTTNSSLENIVYKMLFIDGDEREIPLPQTDLFSVHRRPWSRSKEEVDEQLKIHGFHQQHDSEDAEPSYGYTVTYPGIAMDEVRKKLFSLSLSGKAAHWYKLLDNGDSLEWNDIVPRFYSKFYPPSEIHKDRNRIYNFWPHDGESIAQAWGRLKSLMLKCPIHELPGNVIIDNFYARLSFQDKTLLDTSCFGSFTRNKEEFKRDLLDRIQENTEGWENDKDRESVKDLVTENVEDGHIIFCEDASNIVSHPNKPKQASVPMMSVRIGDHCYYGLCDIGASVSAIPYELYTEIMHEIDSCELEDIDVVIQLANRETISPIGIVRDVEVLCDRKGADNPVADNLSRLENIAYDPVPVNDSFPNEQLAVIKVNSRDSPWICFGSRAIMSSSETPKDSSSKDVGNLYMEELRMHPKELLLVEGELQVKDVQGPKGEGSLEDRMEKLEQEVFKYKKMAEREVDIFHRIVSELIAEHEKETAKLWSDILSLHDTTNKLQAQLYDFQNQNYLSHRGYSRRVTSAGRRTPERKELSGGQESLPEGEIDAIVTAIELDIIAITIIIISTIVTVISTAGHQVHAANIRRAIAAGEESDHDFSIWSEDDQSSTDGESDLRFLTVGATEEESDDDSFSCDFTSSGEEEEEEEEEEDDNESSSDEPPVRFRPWPGTLDFDRGRRDEEDEDNEDPVGGHGATTSPREQRRRRRRRRRGQ
ncbi:hypothetical protein QYE76_008500 [Lolium multiflorum]|uniref:Uncharacterized protein n=1 Tax=Lolium multiflorum TaxID=4521 RepID=A0AAD8X011_LOLMU|nr:hypothetical protein QYE76_008500 [Lolium multiflorum]